MTEDTKWIRRPFTPPESDEIILRPSEVADWIGAPPLTLRWWRREKKGPPHIIMEGKPRYRSGDVRKFIAASLVST